LLILLDADVAPARKGDRIELRPPPGRTLEWLTRQVHQFAIMLDSKLAPWVPALRGRVAASAGLFVTGAPPTRIAGHDRGHGLGLHAPALERRSIRPASPNCFECAHDGSRSPRAACVPSGDKLTWELETAGREPSVTCFTARYLRQAGRMAQAVSANRDAFWILGQARLAGGKPEIEPSRRLPRRIANRLG
jgi:hypothetical protein